MLQMDGIGKAFGGIPALSEVNLAVGTGEIHALVGENGAGKSTLLKILTGALSRDSGTITFEGRPVDFHTPQQAQQGGISAIYQEINLVRFRSIAENIFLGREPRRFGLLDWRAMNREAARILGELGIDVDVTQPLLSLSIARQQMVAIARAVSQGSRLVVLDEPTSSLDDGEIQTLFATLRGLQASGVSMIYVSHKLDELFALCGRVTILRDGRVVETSAMSSLTRLELVAKMLGKDLGVLQQQGLTNFGPPRPDTGAPLLDAEGLHRGQALQNVNVHVRAGEIVGLAGLLGAGRTETARAVFGADPLAGGAVKIDSKPVHFASPAEAIRQGIGFCSEDRKVEGIIPHLSVRENLTLAALPALSRFGIVSRRAQTEIVERFIQRLGIKSAGAEQPIKELSGGNQQKVLLARWLCLSPRLLILDEPTRGIDVGAKGEIQCLIGELATDGMGVLMISSELEELTEGSDRVTVLREGRSVADLPRADVTQDRLLAAMATGEKAFGEKAFGEEAAGDS